MNKKWTKSLLMILLCVCCMFMFKSIKVNAAMTDEAEDYELEEVYNGKIQLFKNFRSRRNVLDITNLVFLKSHMLL